MSTSYDCVDFKGISVSGVLYSNYTNGLFSAAIQADCKKNAIYTVQ